MTTLFSWSSGTLPSVQGSGVTLDTSNNLGFGDSMLLTQVAATACAAKWTFTAGPTVCVRAYFKTPASWPASSANLMNMIDAAVTSQMVRVNLAGTGSPGQIRLVNSSGGTITSSSTGVLSNSTVYRIEFMADNTNDLARVAVFPLQSDTALYDSGDNTATIASDIGLVALGNWNTSPTLGVTGLDQIVGSDAYALIGRDAADTGTDATVTFPQSVTIHS